MKSQTKQRLKEAMDYCNENDKSTEFMIQYMQDYGRVSFETVIDFLESETDEIDRVPI